MLKTYRFLALFVSLGLQTSANAEQKSNNTYFGAGLGLAKISDQTGATNDYVKNQTSELTLSSPGSLVQQFRIFGGYSINENISIEIGFRQNTNERINFYSNPIAQFSYTGNLNSNISGSNLGLLIRPSPSSRFQDLFLNFGITQYRDKSIFSISSNNSTSSIAVSESGIGYFFGLGYEKPINKIYSLRGSITHEVQIGGNKTLSDNGLSLAILKKF